MQLKQIVKYYPLISDKNYFKLKKQVTLFAVG